jgi:hypothetical protein
LRGRGEFVFWVFRQRHVGAGCGSFRMRSHPRTPFPRRAARGCAHALFRKCLSTLHVILCSKKRSSSYAHQSPPLYLPPHIVWAALATHTTFSTHKHARALAPHLGDALKAGTTGAGGSAKSLSQWPTARPLIVPSARLRRARPRRGRSPACLCRMASGR